MKKRLVKVLKELLKKVLLKERIFGLLQNFGILIIEKNMLS
jgi:hypothetical protein